MKQSMWNMKQSRWSLSCHCETANVKQSMWNCHCETANVKQSKWKLLLRILADLHECNLPTLPPSDVLDSRIQTVTVVPTAYFTKPKLEIKSQRVNLTRCAVDQSECSLADPTNESGAEVTGVCGARGFGGSARSWTSAVKSWKFIEKVTLRNPKIF